MNHKHSLTPMEKLLAFCDWERKHNPKPAGDKHIAQWAADEIEKLRARIAEFETAAARAPSAKPLAWRQFPEFTPGPDTECLVEVKYQDRVYRAIDFWEMQREAPLEWSSATVEVGYGWTEHEDAVQRWIPVDQLLATDAPNVSDVVREQLAGIQERKWLRLTAMVRRDGDCIYIGGLCVTESEPQSAAPKMPRITVGNCQIPYNDDPTYGIKSSTAPQAPSALDRITRDDAPSHWNDDARAGYAWGWNDCLDAKVAASTEARK